jgi:polysaccharide export outer membrane protein
MRSTMWLALALAAAAAALTVPGALFGQDKTETKTEKGPDPTVRDIDAYRLRVGDQIEVQIFNSGKLIVEETKTLTVPANGQVSYRSIGKLKLVGMTVDEIQEQLAKRLKDDGIFRDATVGAVVTRFEPRSVFLMGAVQGEVFLPVHRDMRILEVLARAGKLGTKDADFSHVGVRRNGQDGTSFTVPVNVDEILDRNQDQQNIVIFENDIIIVPRLESANPQSAEWVYVLGKVHRPGRVAYLRGRSPFTLTKLIAMCEDFQEFADRTKVKIIRTEPSGRRLYTVDVDAIISTDKADFELKPDDLVYVPETWI